MLNGLLTLRGAWDKLRKDPVLKFFAAGLTFYGMATFEGPLLSIKAVSSLAHYTDWIIGHVHAGALGWNGFMAAGMFYYLVPKLYGTKLYSRESANMHFYLGTFGILLYVVAMWVAGITQGLMWRAELPEGGLQYPNFIETLVELRFMYWMRMIGGLMYLTGFVLMAWNLIMTVRSGKAVDGSVEVASVGLPEEKDRKSWKELAMGQPLQISALLLVIAFVAGISSGMASVSMLLVLFCLGFLAIVFQSMKDGKPGPTWHHLIEGRAMFFTVLVVVAVLIGGAAEIIPAIISGPSALRSDTNVPYTALELEGRDVYLSEGCYNCHSQMIRPFTWEVARYGDVSTPEESLFDHPFQWGSRRTGPDLARVGPKYAAAWHYDHMENPRRASPGSNMPPYPHLLTDTIDFSGTESKVRGMSRVGVPYTMQEIQTADLSAMAQAKGIVDELKETANVTIAPNAKLVALIAYLTRLGNPPPPPDTDEAVLVETAAAEEAGGANEAAAAEEEKH
jgi:cytochrome c oxidase cbb3-type subunit I/II